VVVEADVFTDGHDALSAVLLHRREHEADWTRTPMAPLGNDRWRAAFPVDALGRWRYTVEGWIDRFGSWRRDLEKKVAAGQDVAVDLQVGAALLRDAAGRAGAGDAKILRGLAAELEKGLERGAGAAGGKKPRKSPLQAALDLAFDPETAALAGRHADRSAATRYRRELAVVVDRERARFSAWYEMFPRSAAAPEKGAKGTRGVSPRHGTFADVIERLDYVAGMGFDVLYLPPIHPLGRTHRKGKNNARTAEPGDVGSPWAIGNRAGSQGSGGGGHTDIHPDLGTREDFRALVAAARERGIEIALDVAFQASPDHPWVAEHPEWFRRRPDGTIQYAENPPKKYEDIVPFDFESEDWQGLWHALEGIFEHWIGEGVTIFRVDNPHTKPLRFWDWVIGRIKERHPEVILLSEAFTRPRVMYRLAKLGFTQSYNYFPWRNGKHELIEYFTELTRTQVAEYFRANLWPNTPDILTEALQIGGRPAFVQRFVLAATLGASYGIYGPPFELMERVPREPGSEEYLDSEKYQLRSWDLEREDSLSELIARVNEARRDNPALQGDRSLVFHPVDNDQLLCYSKTASDGAGEVTNAVLVVVSLDPHHRQSGWTHLDLAALGVDPEEADQPFQVHDLLTGARYLWHGPRNYVELDPGEVPAHLFRIRRRTKTEQDFDYFM
ncbi:MAG TPA: alpha-1,4-glucan--maltose-1-phosphate maltosyltransferase, partial [Thermoanaerobaculia bacterium]|nr:alpha-1,4-glucan--maltose-1-phosphate maltosyltransferase [Thermoanaerobaculia bacterium]